MPELAPHITAMPRSGIRVIMDLAWSIDAPVIGLHVGEPSFDTPPHVVQAIKDALDRGATKYVPNAGIPELRTAVAAKLAAYNQLTVGPDQVVISAGGMQALSVAFAATLRAGDEVLIPDPGWPNFAMMAQLTQTTPVWYQLQPEKGFLPDVADLAPLVTDRTRAIIVNSPANPLGTVLDATTAEALCRFADEHDLWLISDECYDALTFSVPHVSPAVFDRERRVLSCFSFSKTYAMTGVRVGYLAMPPGVDAVAAKMQEALVACVNASAQYGALAALQGPQDAVAEMRDTYQERRDAATALLDRAGVGYQRPDGAFYLWIDVRDRTADVTQWAVALLQDHHVAVAPGTTFGPAGEGWIRVSLATETNALLTGLRRIVDA